MGTLNVGTQDERKRKIMAFARILAACKLVPWREHDRAIAELLLVAFASESATAMETMATHMEQARLAIEMGDEKQAKELLNFATIKETLAKMHAITDTEGAKK